MAVASTFVSGFTFAPTTRFVGKSRRAGSWVGDAWRESRAASRMVVSDVAEVAKGTGEHLEHEDSGEYQYEGEELPFEMIPKFERLKANYRGVMSALDDEDLEDVDDTYIKFESMLDDHKVSMFHERWKVSRFTKLPNM